MQPFRSLMDITAGEWLQALRLSQAEIPDVVIVEGSWWREQRTKWRLSYLSDVRELVFPDIFWGRWKDKKVVFCCAYGAPRTVEIIHVFGVLGAKLAVQVGTCGGLQSHLKPGDIVLPETVVCREAVAQLYGASDTVTGSREWIQRAQQLLTRRQHRTYTGTHLTWCALFAQSKVMATWHEAGYLGVDMETATTLAVSRYFQMPAVSMLVVWDDLTRGRSFLDPLSDEELKALDRGNQSVFEVALELAGQL